MSRKPQLKRRGSWNGNDSPPMAPREDFSLNRAELDSISGKELGRLMDSPPSGKMKAPKATDVEVNPETSGFTRRRGRSAKDMDVQPMPPEREPAPTSARPPARRNFVSPPAEGAVSGNPTSSSDASPRAQERSPPTPPRSVRAVKEPGSKSPPSIRKESARPTARPNVKAAKAKPVRLNASAASRIMKGKSAAEAVGAAASEVSTTSRPKARAGEDESLPSRITHPVQDDDEEGEDDAEKLAKQRRRLAEGEDLVAYIDDMGVDWKLVSKRFEKSEDDDNLEHMSIIWEEGSQDGIDDYVASVSASVVGSPNGTPTPSHRSGSKPGSKAGTPNRVRNRSRSIDSTDLAGMVGDVNTDGESRPARPRTRSRTLEDLELDKIKDKVNQFEGVVFHDLANLTPEDLKKAGISLSEPSLDDGRVKVEDDDDDQDDVATDENNRSDEANDIGDAYPVGLDAHAPNGSPTPARPKLEKQRSSMRTHTSGTMAAEKETEDRDFSPMVSTVGSNSSPEPQVKVREFKVKKKKKDDDDDDNKSMVSGMTSMTKRSSQSGKSGSRKQQSMQHAAATAGTLVKLDKMLEAGMDANLTDEDDYTVLMRAVESGNGHIVVRLLKDDHINPSHAEQFKGRSAMHIACMKGMYGIVREMLKDPRVQVHAKDLKGRTPMHLAAIHNHFDIVRVLLGHKSTDPNAKDEKGSTAVHLSVYHSALTALAVLMKHPDVDPNVRDNEGRTAMHVAAVRCLTGAAVHLIKNPRFDPNMADKEGFTALHACSFSALPEPGKVRSGEAMCRETESQASVGDPAGKIAEIILEHPATDPNVATSHGLTPLHLTVRHGRPTIAMLIISHEMTEFTLKDRDGVTPLELARSEDNEAMTFLLESALQQDGRRMTGSEDPYTTPKRAGSRQRPSSAPTKGKLMVQRSRHEWRQGILHSTGDVPPKYRPTTQVDTRPPWLGVTKPSLSPRKGQINMTDKHIGTPMPIVVLKHGADIMNVNRGRRAAVEFARKPAGVNWSFERAGDFGSVDARLRREYDMQVLRYALRKKRVSAAAQGMSSPDGTFHPWTVERNTSPWVIEEWH